MESSQRHLAQVEDKAGEDAQPAMSTQRAEQHQSGYERHRSVTQLPQESAYEASKIDKISE